MSVFQKIYTESIAKLKLNAQQENVITSNVLSEIYGGIVLNSFKWEGLPENIFFDRPELYLYYNGTLAAFYDDERKLQIYPCFPSGSLRPDGFYDSYNIITMNAKTYIRKYDDIVLCQNNSSKIPNYVIVDNFVDRMLKSLRTVDNMLFRAMMGQIISTPNEVAQKVIIEAYNKAKEELLPFIVVNGSSFTGTEILKTPIFDNQIDDIMSIWDLYDKFKHEFLTYYGINNTETQKRERLVIDEVNSNNESIQCGYYDHLYKHRKNFETQCNSKFGTSIYIKKNRIEGGENNVSSVRNENSGTGSGDNTENNSNT